MINVKLQLAILVTFLHIVLGASGKNVALKDFMELYNRILGASYIRHFENFRT